jgi:hypothetical protein
MAMTDPDQAADDRGDILGGLVKSLNHGNEATLTTDARKYLMQKGAGVWFTVIAAASDEGRK